MNQKDKRSRMQADLSYYSHTVECNFLIARMKLCYNDHPFRKFFGYCDKEENDVASCCHEERLLKRKNNPRYSRRMTESRCLPESSYTSTLKKLKEEGILVIRPEVSKNSDIMERNRGSSDKDLLVVASKSDKKTRFLSN
ncbi:unnamed protein product [Thelazia callipaeda]|uniref:COX assembly mitochondrial protein n=1 Tax=Thelazia callipaeda TaxID=103827 RepID=A0A0N5D5X0_THECL|nr:unnamed protein product [Thelazia callipaeda]